MGYTMKRRLVFVICILSCGLPAFPEMRYRVFRQDTAAPGDLLGRSVTVDMEQVSLSEALKRIGSAAGVKFVYAMDPDANRQRVSLHITHRKLRDVLNELLAPFHIVYEVKGDHIVLRQAQPLAGQHPGQEISGLVVDQASGVPLMNVSVRVADSANGTSTDTDGRFFLHAGEGSSLVCSLTGYQTQHLAVKGQHTLEIRMEADFRSLQEVVVTALGVEKARRALGYSVTEVAGKTLATARTTNVMDALEGRVAGVNVSPVNTGPGSSANVIIRGVSSINGNSQPLYVIDGAPIVNNTYSHADNWGGYDSGDGIGNINPDDIETVSVLKGAAAAALYGYRGSKGVVLITTKRGKNGQDLDIELNSNAVLEKVIDNTDYQYAYGQGENNHKPTSLENALETAFSSWGARVDGQPAIQFDGVERPYAAVRHNISHFYRTGSAYTNTLAFTKGLGSDGAIRFAASNLGQAGIVPRSGLNRQSFTLTTHYKLDRHLSLDLKANYIVQRINNAPSVSDAPANPNYATLFIPTTVDIRNWEPGYTATGDEKLISTEEYTTNPFFTTSKFYNTMGRNRFIGMASLRYTFNNGWFLQGRIGEDYLSDHFISVTPTGTAYYNPGTMVDQSYTATERNLDLLAGRQLHWRQWVVNVNAGANYRKAASSMHRLVGYDFVTPYVYNMNNVRGYATPEISDPVVENASVYAAADLAYHNMCYVNITGRNDWYSTLAPGKIRYLYPSVNGSFVFTERWHMPWMDFGKVRLGYAAVGGEAEDPYQTLLNYRQAGSINGIPIGTIVNEYIPNKDLQPSAVKELEAGVEMAFLHKRISLDAAVYSKRISRSIIYATASITSGYSGAVLNIGELHNRGVELLVKGIPVQTRHFDWTVTFNGAVNKNVVDRLAPGQTDLEIGTSQVEETAFIHHVVGKAASQIMAFDVARDEKGKVVIDPYNNNVSRGELRSWGSGIHKWTGGVANDLRYKRFTLSALVDGKFGGKIFSATNYYAYTYGLSKATLPGRELTYGTGQILAPDYYSQKAYAESALFVYDASFIKLRQVQLNYSFPVNAFHHKIKSMTIGAVGRNLWTVMKHTPNIDPESNYSNSNVQGLELAAVPAFRSMGFNLNIKF
ncbi:SusC/RagA family TonB-linked outer membrane protein [Chitinophaga parva]|uniref:SusC/RagA family TonB-linked outer membrane protein n=2 Tax=Chitinophaga parva TaxID=2169414 RepID=A0A2T7BPT6_9BACT|nr:SusC/RagA family TonB-linked outer membrane protein [Chitinophaga parva]